MLYQRKSFTLPAVNKSLTGIQYDFATLTKDEFIVRYGADSYPTDPPEAQWKK